jgi:hypothetical protein
MEAKSYRFGALVFASLMTMFWAFTLFLENNMIWFVLALIITGLLTSINMILSYSGTRVAKR